MKNIVLMGLVGTDDVPEFEVTTNVQDWFQENSAEFIFALILGFILGVFFTYICYLIFHNIGNKDLKNNTQNKENSENDRE